MKIDEAGFQDFRQDATCLIRPQSLLGEKFVDCQPTQPRAPGSEPPAPLDEVPDGEPGAGQHFLPLENNGKEVDIDLINNIMREPYADRFRLIFNDLGAGFAARGEDLAAIIRRADPALRETNRVLAELARQNQAAQPARARRRHDPGSRSPASAAHVAGFINNANSRRGGDRGAQPGPRGRLPALPRGAAAAAPDDGQAARLLRPGDPGVRGVPRRRAGDRPRDQGARPVRRRGRAVADQPRHRGRAEQAAAPQLRPDPARRRDLAKNRRRRAPSSLGAPARQPPGDRLPRAVHEASSSTRPAGSTATTSTATSSAPAAAHHGLHALDDPGRDRVPADAHFEATAPRSPRPSSRHRRSPQSERVHQALRTWRSRPGERPGAPLGSLGRPGPGATATIRRPRRRPRSAPRAPCSTR